MKIERVLGKMVNDNYTLKFYSFMVFPTLVQRRWTDFQPYHYYGKWGDMSPEECYRL